MNSINNNDTLIVVPTGATYHHGLNGVKMEYAFGDAMSPDIMPGDLLNLRQIENIDFILWGEIYKIIPDRECGIESVFRSIHPCDSDESLYVLRASNEKYKNDLLIKKDSIVELYLLTGLVRSFSM